MSTFLRDAGAVTVVAGVLTGSMTVALKLLFRRGKDLEEP
jgi:hypothetical protein